MSEAILLRDQTAVKRLAERLSQCPEVTKYDQGDEKEAGVLAHSFADLEESFTMFLNEQLPRLVDDQAPPSELCDVLLEIGEEFRHILYHIHDPKFYQYLHREPLGGPPSSYLVCSYWVISAGTMRANQITNGIANGRFVAL